MIAILSSCASKQTLQMDSFLLKDTNVERSLTSLLRGEERKRLYGAVSVKEQRERLGLYYTARWNDKELANVGGVLKFEYLQHVTGASVQVMEHEIEPGQTKGSFDFKVIGKEYFTKGRVLAWRLTYWRSGKVIASEQSYLWE